MAVSDVLMRRVALPASYYAIRGLHATYRFREQTPHPSIAHPGGYLLAIWHQNLFSGILAQTGRRHVVIVSRSKDGEPVANLCQRLGHAVARGSSKKRGRDKGGKLASDEMVGILKSGIPGAVTVDGPSGPARVVKPGIVGMARQSGLPIVPYWLMPARYWEFNSWDRFRLPKPGSRIDVYYGDPIWVPSDAQGDAFQAARDAVCAGLEQVETRSER